jgi:hypothetical protein
MEKFSLRAYVKTPVINRGQVTLDALLMAVRGCGDVSDLLQCVDGLYFASAGLSSRGRSKDRFAPIWPAAHVKLSTSRC